MTLELCFPQVQLYDAFTARQDLQNGDFLEKNLRREIKTRAMKEIFLKVCVSWKGQSECKITGYCSQPTKAVQFVYVKKGKEHFTFIV